MYRMRANGALFHNPAVAGDAYCAVGGKASFELDKVETLTFSLPPGNVAYNSMQAHKTIITLEEDGTEIFRGRVMETVLDTFNMLEVYCEGEMSLLKDSLQPPVEYEGSALEYLSMVIANHNAQMDSDKQFTLGSVSALQDDYTVEVKTSEYRETLGDIRSLLMNEYGGHLMVRYSGGVRYLDYVDDFTGTSSGQVQFGVNLIEYENRNDATGAFSMLVPLGAVVDKKRLTIESVTGSIYLTDQTALSRYGKVIKSKTFDGVEDPEELLRLAQEFMKNALNVRTITVKAIDAALMGLGVIRVGEKALINSSPHSINEYEICSKIELDLDNPDQTEYTFGQPPETLTGKMAKQQEKDDSMWHKLFDWLTVTDTELILAKQHISEQGDIISNVLFKMDALNANIQLKADQTVLTELETRVSNAEILIDGANAAIDLKADRTTVTDLETRMSAAEILIDGANAKIDLKAAQSTVDALGERVTSAELLIDGQNSLIAAKADTVRVEALETEITGLLKVENLQAAIADLPVLSNSSIQSDSIDSTHVECQSLDVNASMSVGGLRYNVHSHKVTVNTDGTITLGEVSSTGGSFKIADTKYYKDGVSAARTAGYNSGYTDAYPASVTTDVSYNSSKTQYEVLATVHLGDKTTKQFVLNPISAKSAYNAGANDVTLSASGWSGNVNTITASNGKTMTVTRYYRTANTVSSGDTVFVSYNGMMVNATYRSGGSTLTYISSVAVE